MEQATIRFEDEKQPICPFKVGDIVTCVPSRAGCSEYPAFGKIAKVTPKGKFRIMFLRKLRVDSVLNSFGTWGSNTVIVPELESKSKETVLTSWDPSYSEVLSAGEKTAWRCFSWYHWDPKQTYFDRGDTGD
jgi:hypothetical protein